LFILYRKSNHLKMSEIQNLILNQKFYYNFKHSEPYLIGNNIYLF